MLQESSGGVFWFVVARGPLCHVCFMSSVPALLPDRLDAKQSFTVL